jgi:hypothetical protein
MEYQDAAPQYLRDRDPASCCRVASITLGAHIRRSVSIRAGMMVVALLRSPDYCTIHTYLQHVCPAMDVQDANFDKQLFER